MTRPAPLPGPPLADMAAGRPASARPRQCEAGRPDARRAATGFSPAEARALRLPALAWALEHLAARQPLLLGAMEAHTLAKLMAEPDPVRRWEIAGLHHVQAGTDLRPQAEIDRRHAARRARIAARKTALAGSAA